MNPTASLSQIIRNRRSIKPVDMDAAGDVPRELIEHLLEDATWAPTHGLTEPWRFVVFSGESRKTLAAELQRIYREATPAAEFREDKLQKLGQNPLLAPVVVAACMVRSSAGKIPAWEEEAAVSSAVQNLLLSATVEGLASFWSSAPLLETDSLKNWLGLAAADRCMGLIYIGWPKAGLSGVKSTRRPLAGCVEWRS